jgi:hypothetical protein
MDEWVWNIGGFRLTRENRRTQSKTCPNATLSTIGPLWTALGLSLGLRFERPVTNNCLSHGTSRGLSRSIGTSNSPILQTLMYFFPFILSSLECSIYRWQDFMERGKMLVFLWTAKQIKHVIAFTE